MRRYTDDLGIGNRVPNGSQHSQLLRELHKAQRKYQQGRKLFEQHNYFDCLMKVSKALESFNTVEPPSANLRENLPQVY